MTSRPFGLTPEERARLAELEQRAAQGQLTLLKHINEYWLLQTLRLTANVMSFGQRCLVPHVGETARAALEADRTEFLDFWEERWSKLEDNEAGGANVAAEDWELTTLALQFGRGTWTYGTFVALARLWDKLVAGLDALNDTATGATTTETGATDPSPDAATSEPPHSADTQPSRGQPPVTTSEDDSASGRQVRLQAYKDMTGVKVERLIWETAGVNRTEGWRWKTGVLDRRTDAAKKIEALLATMQMPTSPSTRK